MEEIEKSTHIQIEKGYEQATLTQKGWQKGENWALTPKKQFWSNLIVAICFLRKGQIFGWFDWLLWV